VDECFGDPGEVCGGAASVCTNEVNLFSCECAEGWRGDGNGNENVRCEDVDQCVGVFCGGESKCIDGDNEYSCECADGWTGGGVGENCVDIDECADVVCGGTSSCTNGLNKFTCQCAAGFSSNGDNELCSDIDECASVSCGNDACDCTDGDAKFTCTCPENSGFSPPFVIKSISIILQIDIDLSLIAADDLEDAKTTASEKVSDAGGFDLSAIKSTLLQQGIGQPLRSRRADDIKVTITFNQNQNAEIDLAAIKTSVDETIANAGADGFTMTFTVKGDAVTSEKIIAADLTTDESGGDNVLWTFAPCPTLAGTDHISDSAGCGHGTTPEATCNFGCSDGFYASGASTYTCDPGSHTWTGGDLVCSDPCTQYALKKHCKENLDICSWNKKEAVCYTPDGCNGISCGGTGLSFGLFLLLACLLNRGKSCMFLCGVCA
jgi:hypothetical protein